MLALRLLFPLVILGYLLSLVPLRNTLASLRAIPPWAFGAGLVYLFALALGVALLYRRFSRLASAAGAP